MHRTTGFAVGLLVVAATACGADRRTPAAAGSEPPALQEVDASVVDASVVDSGPSATEAQQYPDVIAAVATSNAGTWTFSVTISSPYDTPERYADGWRVLAPDGTELAVRVLAHDHANEQPFTRSLDGVTIPDGIDTVTIQGRDLLNGYGGATLDIEL